MGRETHYGIVVDNADPEKRGRLKVECPTMVTGETLEQWIEPKFHFVDSATSSGCFFVPSIRSSVTVEIDDSQFSQVSSFEGRWICEIYPLDSVPDVFKENYPNRRGWVTGEGHQFYFDDTEGELEIHIVHSSGTEIFISNDGDIVLKPASGKSVLIGDGAGEAIPLGDSLKSHIDSMVNAFNTHTHTIPGGSTGTPSGMMTEVPSSALSQDHKVK